jgi:GNAT superfamily N-acetyltransferase
MTSSDFTWALDITGREGWGFVRGDFRRILEHTPGGSFVALEGARRVGMLTTLRHGTTCWVGNVVVDRGRRGAGTGRLLVREALRFAAARACRRVALLSRENTAGFYEALGFRRGARFVGFTGLCRVRGPAGPRAVPVSPRLLSEVLALDREASGELRGRLLERLERDFGRRFLVHVEDGRVLGFIVGKPGKGLTEVGPWACLRGRQDVAAGLFRSLAAKSGKRLDVYVPARDGWALKFLEGAGLRRTAAFIDMHRGGRAAQPSSRFELHAIAGLEKG